MQTKTCNLLGNNDLIFRILSFFVAFLMCTICFSALLLLSYLIPEKLMTQNLQESSETLSAEGWHHQAIQGEATWTLDGYTTAIMLNTAGHTNLGDKILEGAFQGIRYKDTSNSGDEVAYFAEGIDRQVDANHVIDYPRYWNGYLVLLRPMLVFLNLNQIRMLNLVLCTALILISCIWITRIRGALAGLSFGLPFTAVNYFIATLSLSLSITFFICLIACLFVLWTTSKKRRTNWQVFFFILGAITVYFDFLCTPLITLGVPLALLCFLKSDELSSSNRKHINVPMFLLSCCITWALGYVSLWVAKWILTSMIYGQDIVKDSLDQIIYRAGSNTNKNEPNANDISRLDALNLNFSDLFPAWALGLIGFCFLILVIALIFKRDAISINKSKTQLIIALLVISLMPYIWYIAFANHSYLHHWFTYRDQLITVFCIMLIIANVIEGQTPKVPPRKHSQKDAYSKKPNNRKANCL